jgi:hypothetical protein
VLSNERPATLKFKLTPVLLSKACPSNKSSSYESIGGARGDRQNGEYSVRKLLEYLQNNKDQDVL